MRATNEQIGPSDITQKQLSIVETFSNCAPNEKKGARREATTDAVAMYIARDMVPIYTMLSRVKVNRFKS